MPRRMVADVSPQDELHGVAIGSGVLGNALQRVHWTSDIHRREGQLTDLGHAWLIECADPSLAALIARDRALRPLCRAIGDRSLVVSPDQELKFRRALRKLGYVVPRQPTRG